MATARTSSKAAGVSPTDLALRAGYLKDAIPLPPDAVLGFEVAGTIDAVGSGVSGTSVGDGVAALLFGLGGYAEYAVAPEQHCWPIPDGVEDGTALALLLVGRPVLLALRRAARRAAFDAAPEFAP